MPFLEDPPPRTASLVDVFHWALRFTQSAGELVFRTFLGVVSFGATLPHFLRLKFTARFFHAVGGDDGTVGDSP